MKLLIYAMESSGASTFCYFLGQRPGCAAVIDVWSEQITPGFENVNVPIVAKATVTTTYRMADHIASFNPDKLILFIRDPVAVYASLSGYSYANTSGSIEEKMSKFDEEYAASPADAVLKYEDFVTRDQSVIDAVNRLGWPCDSEYYKLERTMEDIYSFNCKISAWLRDYYEEGWGFGNIKKEPITDRFSKRQYPSELIDQIVRLSPRLCRRYGYQARER